MPEDSRKPDEVEKLLSEQKAIEDGKKGPIADLLKQREAALSDFDEKLSKLGYRAPGRKRSHHKKGATPAETASKKEKAKA